MPAVTWGCPKDYNPCSTAHMSRLKQFMPGAIALLGLYRKLELPQGRRTASSTGTTGVGENRQHHSNHKEPHHQNHSSTGREGGGPIPWMMAGWQLWIIFWDICGYTWFIGSEYLNPWRRIKQSEWLLVGTLQPQFLCTCGPLEIQSFQMYISALTSPARNLE